MISDDPLLKLSTILWIARTLDSSRSPLQHDSEGHTHAPGLDFLHVLKQETFTAALVLEDSSAGEMGQHLTFSP